MKKNSQLRSDRRVVITGIGVILPNAYNVKTFWEYLRKGNSQISFVDRFPTHDIVPKVAAQINDFDYKQFIPELDPKFASRYNRETLVSISAVSEAFKDAGIDKSKVDPERIGFIDASSRGAMEWWEGTHQMELEKSGKESGFNNHGIVASMPANATTFSAIYNNIQGLVTCLSVGCVSGHHAIQFAANTIQSGNADICFAGGHDFPIFKNLFKIYGDPNARALSSESIDPKRAIRPYDKTRDGFAFGEGAIILCLESLEHALTRKARIYAEFLAHHGYNEADSPLRMDLSGNRVADGLDKLLDMTGKKASQINYFCGHGTATYFNDLAECRAVRQFYKSKRETEWAPLGSIKPIFGHLAGGGSTLNVAATSLMIYNQTLCPTINLTNPDVECDIDHVEEGARKVHIDSAVSFAFSIGSQSSLLMLSSYV